MIVAILRDLGDAEIGTVRLADEGPAAPPVLVLCDAPWPARAFKLQGWRGDHALYSEARAALVAPSDLQVKP